MANKYDTAKIYKIISNEVDDVYYGSTCQPLSSRLAHHVADYKRYLLGKRSYISSFELIKRSHYDIILVEQFPCNGVEELRMRERYYIENYNCINRTIPIRTHEEHNLMKQEYWKQYYDKNKDQLLDSRKEYKLQYYKENKEHIIQTSTRYYELHRERKVQDAHAYRCENINKIHEYDRNRPNKLERSAKQAITFVCECGSSIRKGDKARHEKTITHTSFISNKTAL